MASKGYNHLQNNLFDPFAEYCVVTLLGLFWGGGREAERYPGKSCKSTGKCIYGRKKKNLNVPFFIFKNFQLFKKFNVKGGETWRVQGHSRAHQCPHVPRWRSKPQPMLTGKVPAWEMNEHQQTDNSTYRAVF